MAIEALEAGKHVIIEKPAEVTSGRPTRSSPPSGGPGTQVAVISQHRFDPATEVAVDAIAAASWAG